MTLVLPADLEPHLTTTHDWHDPGVYAFNLTLPTDLDTVWFKYYDITPDYYEELKTTDTVVYVGSAKNVLSRLEDHRDSDVRVVPLVAMSTITGIYDVWWYSDVGVAREAESRVALSLQQQYPDWFVHQR